MRPVCRNAVCLPELVVSFSSHFFSVYFLCGSTGEWRLIASGAMPTDGSPNVTYTLPGPTEAGAFTLVAAIPFMSMVSLHIPQCQRELMRRKMPRSCRGMWACGVSSRT